MIYSSIHRSLAVAVRMKREEAGDPVSSHSQGQKLHRKSTYKPPYKSNISQRLVDSLISYNREISPRLSFCVLLGSTIEHSSTTRVILRLILVCSVLDSLMKRCICFVNPMTLFFSTNTTQSIHLRRSRDGSAVWVGVCQYQILTSFSSRWAAVTLCT